MLLIAKNNTISDIELGDLFGVVIPAGGQLNLTERIEDYSLIADSQELETSVTSSAITINNGTIDLSVSDALNALNFPTFYDLTDQVTNSPIIKSGKDILITFGSDKHDYIKTKNLYWQTINVFIFTGTHRVGTPSAIKCVAKMNDDKYTGSIRLYDSTNNHIISQIDNIENEDALIYTDLTTYNWPTDECIMEIQAKSSCSRNYFYLYSMLIKF